MNVLSNSCSLKDWGVYQKVLAAIRAGTCGDLCSLRWTWFSHDGRDNQYAVLALLLEASQELANGKLSRLHIEAVNNQPACFALAGFEGDVVAEFEINEALPNSVPDARFLVADFTSGRVTNRPLVGFHHGEGAFLATGDDSQTFLFEPVPEVGGESVDPEIVSAIQNALKGEQE